MRDVIVESHQTIAILRVLTPEAHEWIRVWLPSHAKIGERSVVVERSYVSAVIEGMRDEGLRVGGDIYA